MVVAKGYHRKKGIDFEEFFTQNISIRSIRMFLANAPNQNWTVYQKGVKTAFLNGMLNDAAYVSQPEGFVVRDRPTMSTVC